MRTLDGIECLHSLKELNAAANQIQSTGNLISKCTALRTLNLAGNRYICARERNEELEVSQRRRKFAGEEESLRITSSPSPNVDPFDFKEHVGHEAEGMIDKKPWRRWKSRPNGIGPGSNFFSCFPFFSTHVLPSFSGWRISRSFFE